MNFPPSRVNIVDSMHAVRITHILFHSADFGVTIFLFCCLLSVNVVVEKNTHFFRESNE